VTTAEVAAGTYLYAVGVEVEEDEDVVLVTGSGSVVTATTRKSQELATAAISEVLLVAGYPAGTAYGAYDVTLSPVLDGAR